MKQTAMMRRLAVLVGTALVAVLALSGVAWAATTPLAVTKTTPGSGATEVSRTVNVKAYFNHDMRASTITSSTSTFKIRKQGTTTWLGATRSVNNTISPTSTNGSSQSVATLNPDANLAANTTYQVMIVGGSSGVKDVNGNALSANKSWTFTTVTPPNTTINSGPTGVVASTSASFTFSSSKPNSTFQCSLDNSAFAGCASPKSYSGLTQGLHNFRVRAIDASGITNQTAASRNWTVDTVAPDTSITAKPDDPTNSTSASFSFTGTDNHTTAANLDFECKLDGGAYESCTSPKNLSGLTNGSHTFSVRAIDSVGNTDTTPASWAWKVDTIAPTVINFSPANAATANVTTNVTATFSGEMDPSSISAQSFTLSKSGSPVSAQVTYDMNSRTATLVPAQALEPGTTYDAKITISVTDVAGNALVQEKTWSFTTNSEVTVTPTTLDLSPTTGVLVCQRAEWVKVTNNGPGDVTLAAVSITGADAKYFSSGSQQYLATNGTLPVVAGDWFEDQIAFTAGPTPTERNSSKVYSATLTYKDGNGDTIGSPVSLTAVARCLNFG
jgi:hypothetical protein